MTGYEDRPPENWRLVMKDDEAAQVAAGIADSGADGSPVHAALTFCNALANRRRNRGALRMLVTPESLPAWGDFREAANGLADIPDWGFGTMANRAAGDDAVAYFKILSGVREDSIVLDAQVMFAAAIVTLVWRPEFGRWLVHAFGGPLLPERVPHGTPNDWLILPPASARPES